MKPNFRNFRIDTSDLTDLILNRLLSVMSNFFKNVSKPLKISVGSAPTLHYGAIAVSALGSKLLRANRSTFAFLDSIQLS